MLHASSCEKSILRRCLGDVKSGSGVSAPHVTAIQGNLRSNESYHRYRAPCGRYSEEVLVTGIGSISAHMAAIGHGTGSVALRINAMLTIQYYQASVLKECVS